MDEVRIHRRKRVAYVNGVPHRLTPEEYDLMTALGIMDNRLASYEVLLDVMNEGKAKSRDDMNALRLRIGRMRLKIGPEVLICKREFGYILSGDVRFIG